MLFLISCSDENNPINSDHNVAKHLTNGEWIVSANTEFGLPGVTRRFRTDGNVDHNKNVLIYEAFSWRLECNDTKLRIQSNNPIETEYFELYEITKITDEELILTIIGIYNDSGLIGSLSCWEKLSKINDYF